MTRKQKMIRLCCAAAVSALVGCSAAPEPHVSIVQPVDGATVGTTFKVVMAVEGMKVLPAGDVVPNTGHHHLIVDGGYIPMNEVIVKDREHFHYGKGQTEATLHLYPGKHTLTLQFANGHHKSYGHGMSQTITVHVK